jgi:GNAT superfamily N-acetyltransferase
MALVRDRLGDEFTPTEEIFASERDLGTWLVVYEDGAAIACGGLRELEPGVGEIKRMFVTERARRLGHGRRLLTELEAAATDAGARRVRLYTTEVLVEARALYASAGYVLDATVSVGDRVDLWLEKAL